MVLQSAREENVNCEWREFRLGEIAEIFDGPHETPKKTEDGPVFLGISNLVNGRIDLSTAEHLSDSDYASWTKRVIPQPVDIVFSYETRLGEAAAIPPGLQCCLGRRMGLLRARKELVDPQFLLYAYLGPEFQGTLQSSTVQGSTVDRILLTELGAFPIRIPPLPEQRAIAHILGTLDDKIELNWRMNQTLEEMAHGIFQDWFVDFGPVRAKLEGPEPYLPPELWDLFPDRLVDSELGEIPEGWEVKALGEFATVVYGAPFASKGFNSSGTGLPLIRIRDLATHEPSVFTDEQHPKGQLIQPADIVVGMDGEFRVQIWKGPTSWLNQRVCHFKPHAGVPRTFLFEALIPPLADFERAKVGTTVIHLGKTDIDAIKLGFPSRDISDAFAKLTEPLVEQVVANSTESRALAAQRDALLPKLVSGEFRFGRELLHGDRK